MTFPNVIKAAAALLMVTGLSGCFDVDMQVSIVDEDTAIARIESTVSSEIISLADIEAGDADFCDPDGEVIENDADGTITCIETHEGSYDEILPESDDGEPQPTIETISPGRVKVTFPTTTLSEDMTADMTDGDEEMNAQVLAMMSEMFEGHAITMRVAGPKIAETNMELSADGKSAEMTMPFVGLLDGSLEIKEDAYAIVALD